MEAFSDSAEMAGKRCLLKEESCSALEEWQVGRCAAGGGFGMSQHERGAVQ